MNPRRVHDLMRQRFPDLDAATRHWVVAADEQGLGSAVFEELSATHVAGTDLLGEAHRKVRTLLAREDAKEFVAMHLGQGDIRISNRDFTNFVVIAVSGVATGWSAPTRE